MKHVLIIGSSLQHRITVPENYGELSGDQLLKVAEMIYVFRDDSTRCMVEIVKTLTGVSDGVFYRTPPEIMHEEFFKLFDWVNTDRLTTQLLPVIACRWKDYYGPDDELQNIRFAEFDFAERDLYRWHQEPDEPMHLWRFVACLYRPRDKLQDDHRQAFNYSHVEKIARLFSRRLKFRVALAVMLWYKGSRKSITEMYPTIFPGAASTDAYEPEMPSYFSLMRSIAKGGIYGKFEEVEGMYLHNALTEMVSVLEEQEALQEMQKNNAEPTVEI